MHESCPSCALKFELEPGYFVGAMYFSYALAVPGYALLLIVLHLLYPAWSNPLLLVVSLALFLPFAPLLFRTSRLVWMHFDWRFGSRP